MKRLIQIMYILFLPMLVFSQNSRTIAFLNMENVNGDPQYDYLEGMLRGILMFDLGSEEELRLVVRSRLDAVLAEQKLTMTGLVGSNAVEVGELVGADYLIAGEYIFLGEEVMVNLSLIDVMSGQSSAYRARGNTENFLHGLSEELILDILGYQRELQSTAGERSIISMKDVAPGSLYFYTYLDGAEIYIDDQFTGYTSGNSREPYILEEMEPGKHTIALQMKWFGVVEKPQFTFHPYSEEFIIEPGKRLTLRPDVRHYNSWISEARRLLDFSLSYRDMAEGNQTFAEDLSFTDREGRDLSITLEGELFSSDNLKAASLICRYDGKDYPVELERSEGTYKDQTFTIEKIDIKVELSNSRFTIRANRNDIWSGMFWE